MASQDTQVITLPHARAPLVVSMLYRLLSRFRQGSLTLVVDACHYRIEGQTAGPEASITLHAPLKLLRRLSRDGDLGLAEGYLRGEWDTPDLTSLLLWGTINIEHLYDVFRANPFISLINRVRHACRRNNRRGSRRNIAAHYDLGNDFYRLWLDDSMTYSSALFASEDESLEQAQQRKYAQLLASLEASPGDHILEVGCGWGGFAEYAARAGYRVTAITLSRAQLAWARERITRAGLSDRVELRLQDYRDVREQFDHVVSIEMFEAVGEAYWPAYFDMLASRLRPGGRAALQVITIDDAHFDNYRDCADFIQLYIFPGGMLPSPSRFSHEASQAGLLLRDARNYANDYALTLRRWHQHFNTAVHDVEKLGYDRRFIRMWRYYLSYCEAGFLDGRIGLHQYLLSKPD